MVSQITQLAVQWRIEAGVVQAIGALSSAEIGFYDQERLEYRRVQVEVPTELLSFSGNISLRDGHPFLHAHAVLADGQGSLFGGHLFRGTVFACELFVQELQGPPLHRVNDRVTGLALWGEI